MGLFEKIFPRQEKLGRYEGGFQLLNGYQPYFKSWNGRIYESELVRSAIDVRARHISKLKVEIIGSAKPSLQTKLKKAPNEWQTWGQFLYRLSTILDNENTAIIVPVIDKFGEISGVYPILPSITELVQYNGKPVLRCHFTNGQISAILLEECGIMTKFQYSSDLFGEGNGALTPLMELLCIENQGIQEGVKSSASFRFMAKYDNFATDEDLAKERKRFNEKNLKEGGGVLLFPNTFQEIKQIDSRPYVPDASTMELIEKKVFDYFGVNEDVLQNKAYGDKWSAFYEGAVEPFSIQFSEVLTKMLFTMREIADGTRVMATSNRLQYMTTNEKLNVSSQLVDRGILNRDEAREIWNLPPIPDGEGEAFVIRGEYTNATEKVNNENE